MIMNNVLIPFCLSTFAGLSTLIGAIFIFIKISDRNLNKFISFCLSFSIAVMIQISVLDLIPSSFFYICNTFGIKYSIIILILSFIISFVIINLLNRVVDKNKSGVDLYKLGILNMIVLILHNLPEGIATFLSSYHNYNLGIKLSIAIMLHNIPEGISIAVPIYYATRSRRGAIRATLISGLSEPIGAVVSFLFLKNYVSDTLISIILIIVAGLMITLSIQEMFPKVLKYKENKYIYLGFIIGILIVIINIIIS